MQKEKGLDVLLDALGRVREPVEVVIAAGELTDSVYHDAQVEKTQILERKLGHRFLWYYCLGHPELASLYRSASIFVCPSLCEPFGNINIEAMSCGTPVIATAYGGPAEIIEDGVDGLLFPPGRSDELATRIESLLHSAHTREHLSLNALKKVEQRYSWPIVTKQVIDIYRKLL